MSWIQYVVKGAGYNLAAISQYRQYQYQSAVAETGKSQKLIESKSLRDKADFDVKQHRRDVEKFKGKQKVSYLKSGVTMSGSVLEVLADTDVQARLDEDIIRYNAEVGAQRSDYEAGLYEAASTQAKRAAPLAFAGTLLAGAGSVSGGGSYGGSSGGGK